MRMTPHTTTRHRLLNLKAQFTVGFVILCVSISVAAQQSSPADPPVISRITPEAPSARTNVELEGYRLGANLNEGVKVLFVQGTAEYSAAPNGSGSEAANLKAGPQELNVTVPAPLQPGECQVIVEVNGIRSAPLTFQITAPSAPVIKDFRPHLPQAGEMVWIEGSGFSDSDDIVLTDAGGKAHHFSGGRTSGADTAAFPLPDDLPVGEATLRIVEGRSGASLSSNSLPLRIVAGPTPLSLESDWLSPVAPGQWIDLVCTSFAPLKSAERIEVLFRQKEQTIIVATQSPSENGLRVQVPESLAPGTVKIQTRTMKGDETSPWSEPVDYRVLETPVAAKIYSIEIRAVKAEAAFKQGDKILAIVQVSETDYPKVRVPVDKLVPGLITIETRVWRGGRPSPWLYKHWGFDWPKKLLPDGTIGEVPFMDPVPLGPDTAKELTVYPGEKLILQGTFPAATLEQVEVILQSDGRAPVVLRPVEVTNPRGAKISLPENLEFGDWSISVLNLDKRASVTLPIRLRILENSTVIR